MIKKERKKRYAITLITPGIIILMGLLLLVFPWIGLDNPIYLLYVVYAVYAGIKIVEYILTKNGSDFENLYTAIACILVSVSGFKFYDYENVPMVLSITLASWVGIMAIIKLIKLDYYDDHKNGMFYINLVTFSLFLLIGFLTCINLYFNETVETLMLGFFFIIVGFLSLAESTIRLMVTKNLLKIKDID